MSHKFTIDYHVKDGVRYNEQTYFENDSLYVLRYDAKRNNKYYIERYNLTNGRKVSEQNTRYRIYTRHRERRKESLCL